jgi:hypothetical protein
MPNGYPVDLKPDLTVIIGKTADSASKLAKFLPKILRIRLDPRRGPKGWK